MTTPEERAKMSIDEHKAIDFILEKFYLIGSAWDVAKAKKLLQGRKPNTTIKPELLKSWLPMIRIDKVKALSKNTDTSIPIILVSFKGKEGGLLALPIDGWHRVYKAIKLGLKTLPAHKLSIKESRSVRIK